MKLCASPLSFLTTIIATIGIIIHTNNVNAQTITTYPCPAAGGPPTILPISPTASTSTIRIPIISAPNGLCILTRREAATDEKRAPVARSYAHQPWQHSPGLFARTGSGVTVDCNAGSINECDVTLPPLSEGMEYILESYEYSISAEAEAARFLEQATFGPTRESIDAMVSSSNDFATWVENQLSMPPTSHRAFFRERMNPKFEYPYKVGAIGSRPCELHSRWRRYAISSKDQLSNRKKDWYKHLTIEFMSGVGYVWKVDGYVRTVTQTHPEGTDNAGQLELNMRYRILHRNGITWQTDCVGCRIHVQCPTCTNTNVRWFLNPIVASIPSNILPYQVVSLPNFKSNALPTIENTNDYPMFSEWTHPYEHALLNTTDLENSGQCNGFPTFRSPVPITGLDSQDGAFPTVFGKSIDVNTNEEIHFLYDPHLKFYENSLENPLLDGGGQLAIDTKLGLGDSNVNKLVAGKSVLCQNAKQTFLNENHCKLSYLPNACRPGEKPKEVIVIDENNLAGINNMKNTKLYAVTGLPIVDPSPLDAEGKTVIKSPCSASSSRWVKQASGTNCPNTANLGPLTLRTFADLISGATIKDEAYNPGVVQVKRSIRKCDSGDSTKLDFGTVETGDGSCWKHVHISELSVIDLTNADSSKYTVTGPATVTINDLDWFYTTVYSDEVTYPVIGKINDHVDLEGGPTILKDDDVRIQYMTLEYNPNEGPVLVCGSPNEVASDPFNGDLGFEPTIPEIEGYRSWSIHQLSAEKHTVWTELALHAVDQLRQKMAWSLSQIVAVGLPGSGGTFMEENEHYIAFYDLFVTHGFGTYLKLMKAFSFNNIMGGWLTYKGNKSLQYNIDVEQTENEPDENFAREIMQLFSVGLKARNMDGSEIMDESGFAKETYSIQDIMSYARAWTGFTSPSERGGSSVAERQSNDKRIDPMEIERTYRDKYPKTNLQDGYIGDHVALCEDLPDKHFLKKGATFRALGYKPVPKMQRDMDDWYKDPDFKRLQVLPSSPLYAKLCAADANGECTTPPTVVLDENLVYDAAAQALEEYQADTIRTVALYVGVQSPIYYEYIRQPCVELAFFNEAKKVIKDQVWQSDKIIKPSLCGNPKLAVAATMCMSSNGGSGKIKCIYQGERVTYSSAEAVCAAEGQVLGQPGSLKEPRAGDCAIGLKNVHFRMWTNAWCKVQVKIDLDNGFIALVNEVEADLSVNATADVESIVSPDTVNFFKAYWQGGVHPSSLSDCMAISSCQVHGEHCICDTDTTMSQVFGSANQVASINQLVSSLPVGAVDPASYDDYINLGNCDIPNVSVYSKSGEDCSTLSANTIFAFELKNKQFYLKNSKSTVHIVDSAFAFRNPVSFINLVDSEVRDMYYETDSVLESLFYHPSHPPFMAFHLIQRFGISNPSPGFIERVATAYKTGSYDGGRFGGGEYGDLGALVAAILLDSETREVVLDADPATGQVREPLVKVISFFRAQKLAFKAPLHMPTLMSLESRIGQGSFESPSVFSFFAPDFMPSTSSAQSAALYVPEATVLDSDNVLDLYESMFSTIKFGISTCYKPSFEGLRGVNPFGCASVEGDTSSSWMVPEYWPSSTASVDDILDELAILLTSGRLTDKNRAIIKPYVQAEFDGGDVAKTVRAAQELVFSSPEFHATGTTRNRSEKRVVTGYTDPPNAPYKAVVVLMLPGGADSWNMLVPVGNCTTSDQYAEYVAARGPLSLPLANLTLIDATSSNQDCNTWGVNQVFDDLAQLYREGDALFISNMGILGTKSTKFTDWGGDQKVQLFAHNSMVDAFYRNDPYERNPNTGVLGRMLDKLRLQGYQTAANARGAGGGMLQGDQEYKNPVYGVSTSAPQALNQDPTINNIYEVVKELNGVGESTSSVMSETWSQRTATALFEQEQMELISQMPEFDINSYGDGDAYEGGGLGSSFRAIVEHMKSRHYRKVNREAYVLKHNAAYDQHGGNGSDELFEKVDNSIRNFVAELKEQDLWDNVVLVMGSEMGRTAKANSNGGSDHAWGGQYFVIGGQINGGQILGHYPSPFSPDYLYWIPRGRLIPTTPWDGVWNGIANWMGITDDADLDWILPNRQAFDKCTDLFHDTDMFKYGGCTCTGCVPVTNSPTPVPPPPPPPPAPIYEAESQTNTLSGVSFKTSKGGFTGTGYVDYGGSGSYVEFGQVDGGVGGACSIYFRYANGDPGGNDRPCEVKINGVAVGTISFTALTDDWYTWQLSEVLETECPAGLFTLRLTAIGSGPNVDHLQFIGPDTVTPSPNLSSLAPSPTTPGPITSAPVITNSVTATYEVEYATLSGVAFKTSKPGFTGTGYGDYNSNSGSYIEFQQVDGGNGGLCSLSFRYANGDSSGNDRSCEVTINGVNVGTVAFTATIDDWYTWQVSEVLDTECPAGLFTLRLTAVVTGPNVDHLTVTTTPNSLTPAPVPFTSAPVSSSPSRSPTNEPTPGPTSAPVTSAPITSAPVSSSPSKSPTNEPTSEPSKKPTTESPTSEPSKKPVTDAPTSEPSKKPVTESPTSEPSKKPVTNAPSKQPSSKPTSEPSKKPITASPTSEPSKKPVTDAPSKQPTPKPVTSSPTNVPTHVPTPVITPNPTPTDTSSSPGEYVKTIFDKDATITSVGCLNDPSSVVLGRSADETTEKWYCDKSGLEPPGILVSPSHGMMSIAKKLRVYAHNNCPNCDAVSYIVSGRVDASSPWFEIGSGDLPWKGLSVGRNARGNTVSSTYENADSALVSTEVTFPSNTNAYLEYKVQFPETRDDSTVNIQAAEIELPGWVIYHAPTLSPSQSPVAGAPEGGTEIKNILTWGTSFSEAFGGCSTNAKAVHDGTTAKYGCGKSGGPAGWTVTPGYEGKMSVVKALRFYSQNNCPKCDVVAYKLEGRVNASSSWNVIGEGDLPWKGVSTGRNARGLPINSSFESADPARVSTEVTFPSNTNAYLEYRLSFTETRDPNSAWLVMSEVELPGYLF